MAVRITTGTMAPDYHDPRCVGRCRGCDIHYGKRAPVERDIPALLRGVEALAGECRAQELGLQVVVPDELWHDVVDAVAYVSDTPVHGFLASLEWRGVEITTPSRIAKAAGYEKPPCPTCGGSGIIKGSDGERNCAHDEW